MQRGFSSVPKLLAWLILRRIRGVVPKDPPASAFPLAAPDLRIPRADAGDCRVTWIGHSTCLLQIGALNILTDPVWSGRASPVRWAGPARVVPAAVPLEALPPIDLVLLSHNHYDHFDVATIRELARRQPAARWAVPLGLAAPLAALGITAEPEFDWWDARRLETAAGPLTLTATPAQHFSARSPLDRNATLWCGWSIALGARRVFFAGDTGLHPEFQRIGERCGPFDLALMPIGAYDPRWFMRPIHMNPEEAVTAYQALAGATAPVFVPIHWGTFKLTDEPLDEPPARLRRAWRERGLDEGRLWVLAHGETRGLRVTAGDPV